MAAKVKATHTTGLASLPIPLDTAVMEALSVAALPRESGWQFEPKWDGFRCLAFRAGDEVELRAKSGKTLTRYFPDIAEALRELAPMSFVLDGELAIPSGKSLSFEALQLRLHPAESRVRKLAAETPAILIAFDLLVSPAGENLIAQPLVERRAALERFFRALDGQSCLRLTPFTRDFHDAQRWLNRSGGALDGVVAKRVGDSYRSGERAMLKVKRMRTADCVVGGFRYERDTHNLGSLLLGLYNDAGKLDHVGFTSAIATAEKKVLAKRLEALIAKPGFTGNAPGAPSRWSTERSTEWQPLKPELVVEVSYDHVSGDRFRHGTRLLRWRPDKSPRQCTYDQLQPEARPSEVVARIFDAD